MNFSLPNWKTLALTSWVVFSFIYIAYSVFDNFKNGALQSAYVAGQNDTVSRLLEQASNTECKPFNVYAGDKKADLINIACLKQTGTDSAAIPSGPTQNIPTPIPQK